MVRVSEIRILDRKKAYIYFYPKKIFSKRENTIIASESLGVNRHWMNLGTGLSL